MRFSVQRSNRRRPDSRRRHIEVRWGEHGFNVGLRSIAEAAGVSAALVIHHFGSKEGLRKACDDYIAEEIRSGKSASLQTKDPADWFAQMAEIESLSANDGLPGAQACSTVAISQR